MDTALSIEQFSKVMASEQPHSGMIEVLRKLTTVEDSAVRKFNPLPQAGSAQGIGWLGWAY
jgi:hypothetical protein